MRPQYFPATDDLEDAPDGAEVYIPEYRATYKRAGMQWELLPPKRSDDGRFTFDGELERRCICGHTLGMHCAGAPHDCLFYSFLENHGDPCRCPKFRLSRRTQMKARYNSKGWPLCECTKCGRKNYVEPHGTTAACRCTKKEWTEHKNIPYNTPGVSNQ